MLKKVFGDAGEHMAKKFLINKGYTIVWSNYRSPFGEIDIIAEKANTLVFVEVKRRSNEDYGFGFESVDRIKQKKIIRTAECYLLGRNIKKLCRFDVISIDGNDIKHIVNAFTNSYR